MNKGVSAVDWLVEQILKEKGLVDLDIEQAKEMEKQQIIDARLTAPPIKPNEKYSFKKEAEIYYNETYGKI